MNLRILESLFFSVKWSIILCPVSDLVSWARNGKGVCCILLFLSYIDMKVERSQ